MTSTVTYPHVECRPDGVPVIAGTSMKVSQLAIERIAYHWDVDEIHKQHPSLSRAQIHAALAFYYDNQEEMDLAIEADWRFANEMRAASGPSPIIAKLRAAGQLL